MALEGVGGGHGETGTGAPALGVDATGEIVSAEEALEGAVAPSTGYHRRDQGETGRTPLRGLAELRKRAIVSPEARDKLRMHAAVIAIDMERGHYQRETTSHGTRAWTSGYSRQEIMRVMGYRVPRDHGINKSATLPALFREPEWGRALEWERIRRDANYRMEMDALMPALRTALSGMLIELTRRVLTEPEKIPTHVLIPEARKLIDVVGEFGRQKRDQPVDQVINNFVIMVKGLPEEARAVAWQAFQTEMRALTASTADIKDVLQSGSGSGKDAS